MFTMLGNAVGPCAYPQDMVLASPREGLRGRHRWERGVFYGLVSEVLLCRFHDVLCHPVRCGSIVHGVSLPGGGNH